MGSETLLFTNDGQARSQHQESIENAHDGCNGYLCVRLQLEAQYEVDSGGHNSDEKGVVGMDIENK